MKYFKYYKAAKNRHPPLYVAGMGILFDQIELMAVINPAWAVVVSWF